MNARAAIYTIKDIGFPTGLRLSVKGQHENFEIHQSGELQIRMDMGGSLGCCAGCLVVIQPTIAKAGERTCQQHSPCCARHLPPQDADWAERVARMGRAAGERRWPGATAIVLLAAAGRLYTANAGDCRAVLCSKVRVSAGVVAQGAETGLAHFATANSALQAQHCEPALGCGAELDGTAII